MRQPLPDLMDSVAKNRSAQIQSLRANSVWAERFGQLGTVPVPMPTLRDFSDGREAFDTSVLEERLFLEVDVSANQGQKSDMRSSSPSKSLSAGKRIDSMWMALTPSFIGTDEPDDIFQMPQTAPISNHETTNEDMEQYAEPIYVGHDELSDQEPWDQNICSHLEGNNDLTGWLALDSIITLP
jgi:hypothetical protein